ncbi:MAG: protein kinase, partial [Candidatus Hydrogenedentes bacterium]|nr:protein kinase [Candidatus Hydrogenedentota bacterium]
MNLSPGTQLGQFEISSLLGVGGMGEVYRARDTKLGRDVAIKILPEEFSKDRERLARFEREAKTLASLNHPNIGALYDFLQEDGIRFLILELIEGETLADRMEKGPFAVKEALPLFIQIAEALGAAHEKGIVHRDLKPDNIKITPDNTVKVLDFGIARSYQPTTPVSHTDVTRPIDPTKLTAHGTILGTPAYMSPEQVRDQNIDKRSDVWAFGCCLYEALTGSSPFHAETIADMFAAILDQEPDWDALPHAATESVRNLLRRCLEKEPRRRLRDTSDIALQLEQSLSTLRTQAQAGESKSFDELLDWRPEAGEPIPRREHWILESKLGEGGFGQVWLAAHEKTKAKRVFKFCFDSERVRSLKREVVLFRLLKESLGDRDDIAQVIDWEFDRPPYFLESEYTEGGDLLAWAEAQGGIANVSLRTRLKLVAEIAEALAAAHSVGVLHKDLKPSNILIAQTKDAPRAQLTDFGIGLLTDPGLLQERGITATGLGPTFDEEEGSLSGTQLYMAPELIEGKTGTTHSDIYALGVMLYQMVIGDFSRAVAPGWERDVDDELLREDITECVDGVPERRLASASELAERLRSLESRRSEREKERSTRAAAAS